MSCLIRKAVCLWHKVVGTCELIVKELCKVKKTNYEICLVCKLFSSTISVKKTNEKSSFDVILLILKYKYKYKLNVGYF